MNPYLKLTDRVRDIARGYKTGSHLEAAVLALRLDDPTGPMCQPAGTDELGKCRCSICPMADGRPAGCMKYVEPIQSALAQRNSVRTKIKLELLAIRLEDTNAQATILPHSECPSHDQRDGLDIEDPTDRGHRL